MARQANKRSPPRTGVTVAIRSRTRRARAWPHGRNGARQPGQAMARAARSVWTRSGTATPITTRRAAGGAHGARAWSTSLRNVRDQLVLLDDQPAHTADARRPRVSTPPL